MSALLSIRRGSHHVEVALNRPDCRNALSGALLAELTNELRRWGDDGSVRSIVLTGAPPAFCAGLDLREVAAAGARFDSSPLLSVLDTIERMPQPVIAAVHGAARAGGAVLAGVCDVVVCGQTATFGFPGVRRGLIAPLVVPYLCRRVGESHAKWLLLTGETISSQRALELGLVNEVVPDEALPARAREHAQRFAEMPRDALAQTKALFHRLRTPSLGLAEVQRLYAVVRPTGGPQVESGAIPPPPQQDR